MRGWGWRAIDADGTLCERFGSSIDWLRAKTTKCNVMFAKALEFNVR
jgi:hypothetical protein